MKCLLITLFVLTNSLGALAAVGEDLHSLSDAVICQEELGKGHDLVLDHEGTQSQAIAR